MQMLRAVCTLLLFELAGELLHTYAHVPVSAPVLGMVLLSAWYLVRRKPPEEAMNQTADGLLRWLGLLFVPGGVGVMVSLGLLRSSWLALVVGLLGSTLLTLAVTALIMQRMSANGEVEASIEPTA